MAATTIAEVQDQVQKFWAPQFMDELRQVMQIASLVNKEYQGEIKQGGDTVRVSQINAPAATNKTVGVDANSFQTSLLSTTYVDVKADKRAIAAYEFDDLSQLQSQIGQENPKIREALVFAVNKKINDYLFSLVAPSASAPDHRINSVTDFNAAQLLGARLLASKAKWLKQQGWWALLDPSYYNDILGATTMVSKDYVEGEAPMVAGQIANRRLGFNILEDNGMDTDQALLFHPDFLHLVMQPSVSFQVSSTHSNKKLGYIISADIIYGAKLGIDGDKKHILVTASASSSTVVTI